jgi:tetratricopeptide (TPR) repeat protein
MKRAAAFIVVALWSAVAIADPEPSAEQLYRDGQAAYDHGRYDDALAAWQRSYDLSGLAALHYNLAQAYRIRSRPGDCARARQQYQEFVDSAEQSPQRSLAEGYVSRLATCSALPSPPPISAAVPDSSGRRRDRKLAVIAGAASGGALLITGIVLGAHASSLGNEVTAACATSCDWSTWKGVDAAGHRDAALGWTFGVLGTAALAGSAVFYWFGVRDVEVQVVPVATQLHTNGVAISWSHSW